MKEQLIGTPPLFSGGGHSQLALAGSHAHLCVEFFCRHRFFENTQPRLEPPSNKRNSIFFL